MSFRKRLKETLVQATRSIFDEIFLFESRNIQRWRQNRALEETGAFIEDSLPNTHSFETRYALFDYVIKSQGLADRQGLVCEFGVATGKSINYLARRLKERTLYGFDSFEGLPETWRANYAEGTFKTTLPAVQRNVQLIPGLFQDTLAPFLDSHPGPALLLHLDADLYSSTKTVLESFRSRLGPGAILIFDEYFNYPGWQNGEHKAFTEFITATKFSFEYLGYNALGTQLAVKLTVQ